MRGSASVRRGGGGPAGWAGSLEGSAEGDGFGGGLCADLGEGGGQQREGAGDRVAAAQPGLDAGDVAVDGLVVRVEAPDAFEQVEHAGEVGLADGAGQRPQGVEDSAAQRLPGRFGPVGVEAVGEVAAVEGGGAAQRGEPAGLVTAAGGGEGVGQLPEVDGER